jgi:hypothetical protein
MIGFVFFEAAAYAADSTENFQYLLDLVYKTDKFDLNEQIYDAAFAVQRLGGEGAVYPPVRPPNVTQADYNSARDLMNNSTWRANTYKFCNQSCVVFSFRLYDAYNRFVNYDSFELESGGCEDTFYTDDTPFNVAASTPPVPLIQDYLGTWSAMCCADCLELRLSEPALTSTRLHSPPTPHFPSSRVRQYAAGVGHSKSRRRDGHCCPHHRGVRHARHLRRGQVVGANDGQE